MFLNCGFFLWRCLFFYELSQSCYYFTRCELFTNTDIYDYKSYDSYHHNIHATGSAVRWILAYLASYWGLLHSCICEACYVLLEIIDRSTRYFTSLSCISVQLLWFFIINLSRYTIPGYGVQHHWSSESFCIGYHYCH